MDDKLALPYLHSAKEFAEWINGNQKWVQLYPFGTWSHPIYSDTTIDSSVADKMVQNFNDNVAGRDIIVEYDHGMDKAKGGKAAGKVLKVEVRDNGLWGLVEFNDIAKQEIDNGEWNYWSSAHYDSWTNPQTNQTFNYVLENPSLTNRPYVRGMVPLNFSEIVIDPKEFATWTRAYINNLPDSAFLYIESGGKKDNEGKTVPRSLRHLPVYDANGKLDLAHVRDAIGRAPQMVDVKGANVKALQAKARGLLKSHSTTILEEHFTQEEIDLVFAADPALLEDGDNVNEDELRQLLGVGEDVDLFDYIKGINEEVGPLREFKKEHSARKQFAELYPDEAKELEDARTFRREQEARRFSETFSKARVVRKTGEGDDLKEETTGLGFSALVIEKIGEFAKQFSDGKADISGFKVLLDTMMDNGIVDYGTHGSSREDDNALTEPKEYSEMTVGSIRKEFHDKVKEIEEKDNLDTDAAYAIAATKYPELFQAYKTRKPILATQ